MKKLKYIILIALFLVNYLNMYSNEQLIKETQLLISDTLNISQEDFKIADKNRYTILGELPLKNTKIKPLELSLFGVGASAFLISQHIYQKNTIWTDESKFHFVEDGHYALWVDKVGHFYGAYLGSYGFHEFLTLSGFSTEAATLWGTILGLSYSTYVEIMDGYAINWGFSPSDFYSDVAGSIFYLMQHYIPVLQNFTPKFNYIPANLYGEMKRSESEIFIDDYSSQTFWMSVNVYNLLPQNSKKYWLPWLDLSLGYAGRNVCNYGSGADCDPVKSPRIYDDVGGSPRFIIALDYDLVKLLPDGGSFWNWFKQTLNYLKLPSPAIEFGETTRVYLLYPFHF